MASRNPFSGLLDRVGTAAGRFVGSMGNLVRSRAENAEEEADRCPSRIFPARSNTATAATPPARSSTRRPG